MQLSVSPLTVKERRGVEYFILKLVQKEYFGKLYDHVQSLNREICFKVKKKLKIKMLSMFCDQAGILRSHSRIVNADMTYEARSPMILPKQHNFVSCFCTKFSTSLDISGGLLSWPGYKSVSGFCAAKHLCVNN